VTNPEEEESKGPVPAAASEAAEEVKHTAQSISMPNKERSQIVRNFNVNNLETF
jgi:hypothetical protein